MSVNKKTRERQPGSFVGRSRHILVSLLPGMLIAFLLLGWKTNPGRCSRPRYVRPATDGLLTVYRRTLQSAFRYRQAVSALQRHHRHRSIDRSREFPDGKVLRPLPPGGARGMASERACEFLRVSWYVKNVNVLMNGKGIEYARHCEGCHNPIALTSGAMTKMLTRGSQFSPGRDYPLGLPCNPEGGSARNRKLCAGATGGNGGCERK